MRTERGFAYCGLACCLCSEDCTGCKTEGCKDKDGCKNYSCCQEKGLSGCYECAEFPCTGSMLDKMRIRAFSRFLAEHGEEKLLACLARNETDGIVYHHAGKLTGDYDEPGTEQEIMAMILNGKRTTDGY